MKRAFLVIVLGLFVAIEAPLRGQTSIACSSSVYNWPVGKEISAAQLKHLDMAKCFTAEPLSDAVFSRINGVSYKQNAHIKRADLRYVRVLHVNFQGHTQVGELICNKRIAARLLSVFKQLYAARYPIERMVLIDQYGADDVQSMTANNTSCFNYRAVQGSSKLSKHSMGFAIDINPLYNPCVRRINGKQNVSPPKGRAYADRSKAFSYKITRNDLCYKLFTQQGFTWGGNWRSVKDYQHFEWR